MFAWPLNRAALPGAEPSSGADRAASRSTGTATLVGAGPGDPDLLTLRAMKAIQRADAVLFDALIDPAMLDLAPQGARRIDVGKRCGRHAMNQAAVNRLIVRLARSGAHVVRLKGRRSAGVRPRRRGTRQPACRRCAGRGDPWRYRRLCRGGQSADPADPPRCRAIAALHHRAWQRWRRAGARLAGAGGERRHHRRLYGEQDTRLHRRQAYRGRAVQFNRGGGGRKRVAARSGAGAWNACHLARPARGSADGRADPGADRRGCGTFAGEPEQSGFAV